MCNVGNEEEEVKNTITSQHYIVPTVPSVGPSVPHHSACIANPPGYYHQLAGEDSDAAAEHLDCTFLVGYDDIIASV